MSDAIIVALIGLVATLLGASVGAFGTIRAAQIRLVSDNEIKKSDTGVSCAVIGLTSSLTAIVGLVLGVMFAIYVVNYNTDAQTDTSSPPTTIRVETVPTSPVSTPNNAPANVPPIKTATSQPPSSQESYTIIVPANAQWYDTNIQVNAGQTIEMISTGNAATLTGADSSSTNSSGPNGQETICPNTVDSEVAQVDCLMNSAPYGALVARIEDSAPFKIGAIYSAKASTSGTLYLGVNDHYIYFDDNQGFYTVTLTIK